MENLNEREGVLETTIREVLNSPGAWSGDSRLEGFLREAKEICLHYASNLGLDPVDVFKALEKKRGYSFPNYYQWSNFPKLKDVRKFESLESLRRSIQPEKGFRCPMCKGVSRSPYECDSGLKMGGGTGKTCDWKSYGLFKTMANGIRVLVTNNWLKNPFVDELFMPIAYEESK